MMRLMQVVALIGLMAVLILPPWAINTNGVAVAEDAQTSIADVSYGYNKIFFSPKVQYDSLLLRIALPNGEIVERSFAASVEIPSILVGGNRGMFRLEGHYTYELSLVAAARTRPAADRATAGLDNLPSKGLIQSGAFMVQNGMLVNSSNEEAPYLAATDSASHMGDPPLAAEEDQIAFDQVILDDLIVDGSLCVGQDCVNGESFGFDTIRLKENNLRIKFQDTSNTASFPTRDWQITANESNNGGLNKFSIDDIDGGRTPFTIEAGAPSHSLYVDDGGRIGLGTSTPVADVHAKSGNTPTVRLEQDGSSGFTPQTWDVAGNEANFFVRDATNGSTLPIRLRPGAPSSSIDIASDGDVGIGTDSPGAKLHVAGNALIAGNLELSSSRKLKENIRALDIADAKQALTSLQPVRFKYRTSPKEESLGFIAEDVPDLVATEGRTSISTMDVVAVLTKVVQAQQQKISQLEKQLNEFEKRTSSK
jgi:hypothetical protein